LEFVIGYFFVQLRLFLRKIAALCDEEKPKAGEKRAITKPDC